MVRPRARKTLRVRALPRAEGPREDALLAMSSVSMASSGVAEQPLISPQELGIDLEDLESDAEADSGEASPPDDAAPSQEALVPVEMPEEAEAARSLKDLEEVLPRLPFLLTERDGRDIVLFSRSKFLPTVRIKLRAVPEAPPRANAAPSAQIAGPCPGPGRAVDFTKGQEVESLMEELGLPFSAREGPARGPEDAEAAHAIPPGSIVLLDGADRQALCQVGDALARALLGTGLAMTYVSTRRDLPEVLDSLFDTPSEFSQAVHGLRLLVIPVYPLLRGQAVSRPCLLEKLTGSPQLFEKDVILIQAMTDFLDEGADDLEALRIWPFVRKLASAGKVVVLGASSGHKAIKNMREGCTVHLQAWGTGKGAPAVQVVKAPQHRPDRNALIAFQVNELGRLEFL